MRCSPRRIVITAVLAASSTLLLLLLLQNHHHSLLISISSLEHSPLLKLPLQPANDDNGKRSNLLPINAVTRQSTPDNHPHINLPVSLPTVKSSAASVLKLKNYTALTAELSMSTTELEWKFHEFVSQLHATCNENVRVGNKTDGGWDVCMTGSFRLVKPCLVYSFGVGDNWSFDDESASKYGCTVRSFDPSINKASHLRGDQVWFYNIGIGKEDVMDADYGWKLKKLSSLISMCKDDMKTIDFLKLDVEGSEWGALESMLADDALSHVKQLALEVHTREIDNLQSSRDDLLRYWTILHQLETIGFRKWYWHFNIWGYFPARDGARYLTCCYELVFVNINFL